MISPDSGRAAVAGETVLKGEHCEAGEADGWGRTGRLTLAVTVEGCTLVCGKAVVSHRKLP